MERRKMASLYRCPNRTVTIPNFFSFQGNIFCGSLHLSLSLSIFSDRLECLIKACQRDLHTTTWGLNRKRMRSQSIDPHCCQMRNVVGWSPVFTFREFQDQTNQRTRQDDWETESENITTLRVVSLQMKNFHLYCRFTGPLLAINPHHTTAGTGGATSAAVTEGLVSTLSKGTTGRKRKKKEEEKKRERETVGRWIISTSDAFWRRVRLSARLIPQLPARRSPSSQQPMPVRPWAGYALALAV